MVGAAATGSHGIFEPGFSSCSNHLRSRAPSKAVSANGRLSFEVALQPGEAWHACLLYALEDGEQRFHAPRDCVETASNSRHSETMADWLKTVVKIETSNEEFYRLFRQALEDMAALRLPIRGTDHMAFIPAAGLPWFVAPFGRDSLLVSLQNILIYPEFARGALEILGALQAQGGRSIPRCRAGQDPPRVALRRACAFQADPAHAVLRDGGRDAALSDHAALRLGARPATKACWSSICRRRKAASPGSTNTATATAMDSRNIRRARRRATRTWAGRIPATAVMYPDGSLVKGPKALCELQGYVYNAWVRMAEVFDALGKPDRATRIAHQGCRPVRALQRSVLGRGTRVSMPMHSTATRTRS